ncbi:N(G),N(G)-dimethylarginine dimethylaminohydrolase 1-like [Sycon ciliatum]|uniref:N(G),N(G)-dimethylarginine dimethylaminohydrolase 1-like n=1 Tax=Sycon ciliatum TaxID=27933 RepID=UPI0020A92228|eukprot:scpid59171/ scgid9046/ N(G),N(G)-dimethylarginine dimethylaminohydrolase 1; DDAHI; Dimethylargininase-1
MLSYSGAVVRGIASSLPANALRMSDPGEKLDLDKANQEHRAYVAALQNTLGAENVHVLDADDKYPDCVFVEDPVVVCNGVALMTRPGHTSRRGEGDAFLPLFERLGIKTVVMEEPACMDGGDVLFTGSEFFVGLSKRTNQAGIDVLAATFPSHPVHAVPVEAGLHLKSMMSMAAPGTIAIGCSGAAQSAKQLVSAKATSSYTFLEFADDLAANVVHVNGKILHVPAASFERSRAALAELGKLGETVQLCNEELNKVDGALTCCSVLLA